MIPPESMSPVEHVDVLIVGAGLSGIGAAHHLQTDSPWATYAIFEARGAIGGTEGVKAFQLHVERQLD